MVERKHQHLLNVARALYFHSWVPIKFWGDCVLTTAYLINKSTTPLLHSKTLYQLLYQTPVDYSSFRVFGSLCFVSTLPSHRSKFHPRAKACIFIGYPPNIKGYKLYDLTEKSIFISRDVQFHEHIFSFHSIISFDEILDPFSDLVLPLPVHDFIPPSSSNHLLEPTVDSSSSHSISPIPIHRSSRATRQTYLSTRFSLQPFISSPTSFD